MLKICSLSSGSSGNATFVSSGRTTLLVDCGASAREVTARLADIGTHPAQLDGILVTHAHTDHYRSAGTIHARHGVPVFVDPSTARALARRGARTSWRRIVETRPIPDRIGDIEVRALDTSHGFPPGEGRTVVFRLDHDRSRIAVVTDLGVLPESMTSELSRLDAIVLEANYDEARLRRKLSDRSFAADWPYLEWVLSDRGHLSNAQCGRALSAILTDRRCHVFLGHLSENHQDPRRDNNDHRTAEAEVQSILERAGVPMPEFHRTWRIGRLPGRVSDIVQV